MNKLMKKLKFFVYLNLIILFLSSCGTVKEGFTNQKKNSSDEFLVEKKSPLIMPPDFEKLPIPKIKNEDVALDENNIKGLISNDSMNNSTNEINDNLEGSILGKIKSN